MDPLMFRSWSDWEALSIRCPFSGNIVHDGRLAIVDASLIDHAIR